MVVTNQQISTSNATTATTFERLRQGYQSAAAGSASYVSSAQRVAASNQQLAGSSVRLGTGMEMSRGAMKQTAGEMTNYISRSAGMFISTVGLSQAVQESVGMQEALADQHKKVAESQELVNLLQQQGLTDTKAYDKAVQALEKDQRGLTVINRNAAFAYSDQLYFIALIGVEIISVLIPAYKRLQQATVAADGANKSFLGTAVSGFKTFFDALTGRGKSAADSLKLVTTETAALTAATTAAGSAIGGPFNTSMNNLSRSAGTASAATKVVAQEASLLGPILTAAGAATLPVATGLGRMDTSSKSLSPSLAAVRTEASLASTIMPSLVSGLAGGAAGMTGMTTATTGATAATVAKTSALRAALPLISRLGVIGAVVGTALLLYANNTFGARDAINALGVALGKLLPGFQAIGDALVGLAGQLGLTGEEADKISEHFANAKKGFDDMAKGWDAAGDRIRTFFGVLLNL